MRMQVASAVDVQTSLRCPAAKDPARDGFEQPAALEAPEQKPSRGTADLTDGLCLRAQVVAIGPGQTGQRLLVTDDTCLTAGDSLLQSASIRVTLKRAIVQVGQAWSHLTV